MKVVFLSNFSEQHGGGEGQVAFEIARAFAKKHETAIVIPGSRNSIYQEDEGLTVCTLSSSRDGTADTSIVYFSPTNIRFYYDFLKEFGPDVIHAHTQVTVGLVGQVWAIMNGTPFIYTAHELPTKLLDFNLSDLSKTVTRTLKFLSFATQGYLRNFYNNCAAVVALNQSAFDDIRKFNYKGKIEIIPNGMDLSNYIKCKCTKVSTHQKNLLFVGYLTKRKNQEFLIEVMKYLPRNYRLQLVGTPLVQSYLTTLKAKVPSTLKGHITFTGYLPHTEIPKILENTHVFVSASTMEVQSRVIMEAMAAGTPIVGLTNETVSQFVDEKVGYRLPKNATAKQFAEKVMKICELSQPEYDKLCKEARKRLQPYSWDSIVDKTALMYQKYIKLRKLGKKLEPHTASQRVTRLLSFLSPTKARDAIVERYQTWIKGEPTKEKPITKRTVPRTTLALFGITLGFSAVVFGVWKLNSNLGKRRRR